ncbi:MAG: zinc ribbon domain-containing protein [Chloroflexi bacterium]|nr:zinc ribbon domain-containing protein [Chloroflexota bacterium]
MRKCPRCDSEISGHALFCPRCGKRLPAEESTEPQPEVILQETVAGLQDDPQPVIQAVSRAAAKPSNRLTIMACLVAVLVGAALITLVAGAIMSGRHESQKLAALEAQTHYLSGLKRIDSGEYQLAIAEFKLAMQLDPSLTQAQQEIDRATAKIEEKVTPIVAPTITAVPISEELSAIEEAYNAGNWDQVIQLGNQFMNNYPGQSTDEVGGMLYQAYIANAGQAVDEDRLGDAVRYLDQALVIKPDDETASTMRQLAVLYQEGSSQFGADWESAISTFEQLAALDINYKDVYSKLYNAHLGYAAEADEAGSYCLAAEQYALANEMIADDNVAALQSQAEINCASQPTDLPPAAPGTFIGQIVRTDAAESQKIYIGGYVLSADNKAVKSVRVKISAFDWSAVATTDSGGHYSFDGLTTATTYTLTLLDVAAAPVDVPCELGQFFQVNFVQMQEEPTAQAQDDVTPTPQE